MAFSGFDCKCGRHLSDSEIKCRGCGAPVVDSLNELLVATSEFDARVQAHMRRVAKLPSRFIEGPGSLAVSIQTFAQCAVIDAEGEGLQIQRNALGKKYARFINTYLAS